MILDPVKVHRVFGAHPERGKPLSILPKVKVTVGKKHRKGEWVDDTDVLVTPCVKLKRQGKESWQVTVAANCRPAVELWLMANCR